MRTVIHKCSLILDKISALVTGIILVALCLIIDYSVVMRFIFDSPVKWQYELTLVGLCWATFIGMPMTFHKQEHLRLTFVTDKLKPATWRIYMDVIDLLLIVFLVVGIINSISVVQNAWGQLYQTIPVSRGIYYLSFPIGAAFSIVHLIDIILNRNSNDAPTAKGDEEVAA
ncbi:MAG: TRAP transporter small permease [Oscillospiraceae bacterium]|jgi:TRAP-type C4-dicarboxylate transport system permease small subunit|nr:TRAP transporter small permease [Oscillospiraceae bacterium]MBQ1742197.1 TRAP transporter small permease [Oscillospiraceae bacterium]MBQ1805446.1 TRAP transporter small permease [Oscillospiraceae bacterium]MBQ1835111.1 TRAP transporter small permease [Oscillospiraceae bacterium]MBQ2223799.1 TRAP transporter small permease [Oscillospiraceae bacterium]